MAPNSEHPSAPLGTPDLELLRKFEPVVYYTKGETFFPTEVEYYVNECSLWEHNPDGPDELLVKQGQLTLDKLVARRPAGFGSVRYLRFVESLDLANSARVLADRALLRRKQGNTFHAGIGRLARGGIMPRLADALFSLSFLLRGKVSAASAAAAELDYNAILEEHPQYRYYGRVVRQNGWTVLQYWFFFCFNSWRSGFHGVNDHESDWEMANVYLYEQDGQLIPEWVAYASHDFHGDDLRRRWDDAIELKIENGHPVIHAAAGSHASYFRRGEYQAEVSLPVPEWVSGLLQAWNKLWTETLGQPPVQAFHIPFVDFARGDGLRIGPDGPSGWSPVQVDKSVAWVSQYRGLWGLFARDPISGENAPGGPMYNRDGSPRAAWYDPLGFAGLEKVPPPPKVLQLLEQDSREISRRQMELGRSIPQRAEVLALLGTQLKAMEGHPHLARQYAALEKQIATLSAEVHALRRENSENTALLEGLTQRLTQIRLGKKDDPQAHLRRLAVPDDPAEKLRFDRLAEGWAAISLSLLMFAIAGLVLLAPHYLWAGLGIVLILFLVVDSILRRAFVQTVGRITLLLAMFASVILLVHFWKWMLLAAVLGMGISLMVQRLRELTG